MTTSLENPLIGPYADRIAYPTEVLLAGQWWIQTDEADDNPAGNYQWNGLSWDLEPTESINSAALVDSHTTFFDPRGVSIIITYANYETTRAYKFILGDQVYSSFSAYQNETQNFARLVTFNIEGKDSQTFIDAICPVGQTAVVNITAQDGGFGNIANIALVSTPAGPYINYTANNFYWTILDAAGVFNINGAFVVDYYGNVTKIRGVDYSWPSTQGAAGSVAENDGAGNISWSSRATFRLRHSASQSIANNTIIIGQFDTEDQDTDNMHYTSSAALTGTVSKTNGSPTLTGSGTSFTTELSVGQVISVPGGASEIRVVTAIANDTSLTVSANYANTASGQTATRDNRYVAIRTAGTYIFGLQGAFASNSGGYREFLIQRRTGQDSTSYIGLDYRSAVNGDITAASISTEKESMNQWDIVDVQFGVVSSSGGSAVNLNASTNFSPVFWGRRVGP